MTLELACKDLGMDCGFVAKGENMDELMESGIKHGKKVHSYTDKQLKEMESHKMMKKIKAAIKKV